MAKRLDARKVRGVLTYTVDELARALGVTEPTVRAMIKRGMPALANQKPMLILGEAARNYIDAENEKARQPLSIDQLYCLTCKAPTRPLGAMVDLVLSNRGAPRITGLCEVCEGSCSRVVSRNALAALGQVFDIAISGAGRA